MKQKIASNFLILLFLIGWIIPVAYYGLTDSAPFWLPRQLKEEADVSRLFYRRTDLWRVYEIQVRRAGSSGFETISEEDYFHWKPFGYRTQFQRLMNFAGHERHEALAYWLRNRISCDHQSVTAIRFVYFPVAPSASSTLRGHYVQPVSSTIPSSSVTVVSEYTFVP